MLFLKVTVSIETARRTGPACAINGAILGRGMGRQGAGVDNNTLPCLSHFIA